MEGPIHEFQSREIAFFCMNYEAPFIIRWFSIISILKNKQMWNIFGKDFIYIQ